MLTLDEQIGVVYPWEYEDKYLNARYGKGWFMISDFACSYYRTVQGKKSYAYRHSFSCRKPDFNYKPLQDWFKEIGINPCMDIALLVYGKTSYGFPVDVLIRYGINATGLRIVMSFTDKWSSTNDIKFKEE